MTKKIDGAKLFILPAKAYKAFMQSGETLKWHMKNNQIEGNPELTKFVNDLGLKEPQFLMTLTGRNNGVTGYIDLGENKGMTLLHGRGFLSFDSKPSANLDLVIGENIGELPALKLNASYKMDDGFDMKNAELRVSTDSSSQAYDIKGSLISNGNEIEIAANTKKLNDLNQRTGIMNKLGFDGNFEGFDGIFKFIDQKFNQPIKNLSQNLLNGYKEI